MLPREGISQSRHNLANQRAKTKTNAQFLATRILVAFLIKSFYIPKINALMSVMPSDDVFTCRNSKVGCSGKSIPRVNLEPWRE